MSSIDTSLEYDDVLMPQYYHKNGVTIVTKLRPASDVDKKLN